MYPNDGCGDPKVVKINKDLVFVFVDTQWWLQDWSKEKKMNKGCEIKSRGDFLKRMEEIFLDHKNDEIVVLMHHPIKSNGIHGGNFSINHHLFPMHEKGLWIPLPVIGSLYPIYRQITGRPQDITNSDNQAVVGGINDIAKKLRVNVLFAAGHEHGLQYFNGGKLNYIVSGAGSQSSFTKKGGDAEYARARRGFAKVLFYDEFEIWVEFYTVEEGSKATKLEYRTQVRAPRPGTIQEEIIYPEMIESKDTLLPANANFAAGSIKKAFLGKQYREMWATPVTAEMIDLEQKLGGLTPIKKGGGMASNSLRMQHENGKQYILRSINKDYTKLVPPNFGNLKLLDVMKDQNSASHPYSALIIPTLSKAAGIFYTDPKLIYLKHQKGLGNYNSQFPEELYLLEERPSGDWSDAAQFGNSSEIIGYVDLLTILREKKNHFVDQEWVLKSRIFDLFIHDWDRHDDQWRWASFEEGDKTIYRPIPRDRDQAFYKFVGVIPSYIATFMMKKFKTMKDDVKDVKNLSFNAKHFDRYFLNELEWSEWEAVIDKLKMNLTDGSIEASMLGLPEEVRSLNDQELIRKLKSRRDKLKGIGKRLYDFLAKEVEVSASDNKDHFVITRNADGSVHVQMHIERKDKGELPKYERTFYPEETKEIRLYGLRGRDEFEIRGSNNDKIRIRVIGGEDKDKIRNETTGGKIYAYDGIKGIKIDGPNIKDMTSSDIETNEYDRDEFKYNTNFPILTIGSTVDDGLWFGGAISWVSHGWRKDPYKARQKISFSFAPGSQNAFSIGYNGHFPNAVGSLDFMPDLSVDFPRYENFFGLGNDSFNEGRPTQYNWVKLQSYGAELLLQAGDTENHTFQFGPVMQSHDVELSEGRVSVDEILGFQLEELERRNYWGGKLNHSIGYVDSRLNPSNGFRLTTSLQYLNALSHEESVTEFSTEAQLYLQIINKPRVIFANGVGYQKTSGDQQFHQYADLGNTSNLRGFRNNRFRGSSVFYHNLDLRLHFFKWNNSIIPMDVGVVGGYDYGRVHLDDEDSEEWHTSRTIGLSLELLGAAVLQPYYSFTDEGNVFSLKMGFSF